MRSYFKKSSSIDEKNRIINENNYVWSCVEGYNLIICEDFYEAIKLDSFNILD